MSALAESAKPEFVVLVKVVLDEKSIAARNDRREMMKALLLFDDPTENNVLIRKKFRSFPFQRPFAQQTTVEHNVNTWAPD